MEKIRKPASATGNGGEFDTGASPQVVQGTKVLTGRTDGVAPSAGQIGEKITWVTPPGNQSLTTTETDWTNATITLTAGVWLIVANISANYTAGNVAGNEGSAIIRLTDASNNIIQNNDRQLAVRSGSTTQGTITASVPMSAMVSTTGATYKLRVYRTDNVGTGSGTAFNVATTSSDFFAIRIA